MMEYPEKLFVVGIEEEQHHREGYADIHTAEFCLEREWNMDIEYIRADIAQAEIARLREAGDAMDDAILAWDIHIGVKQLRAARDKMEKSRKGWKEATGE